MQLSSTWNCSTFFAVICCNLEDSFYMGWMEAAWKAAREERRVRQKSTERIMNIKYFFSAALAIVIVVLKEACNELRECGISNLLMCHKEQNYMECTRWLGVNAQALKIQRWKWNEALILSDLNVLKLKKHCMFNIFTQKNVTQNGYKLSVQISCSFCLHFYVTLSRPSGLWFFSWTVGISS